MSLRDRLRRAEKRTRVDMIEIPQPNGPVKRFPEDAVLEAMVSSWERMREHMDGEPLSEPHPLLEALYNASEEVIYDLSQIHGEGIMGFMAGEESIVRGDVERPGPAIEWDEEGKVCR